jgi:hypothetical protein
VPDPLVNASRASVPSLTSTPNCARVKASAQGPQVLDDCWLMAPSTTTLSIAGYSRGSSSGLAQGTSTAMQVTTVRHTSQDQPVRRHRQQPT